MKRKILVRIILGIAVFVLVIVLLTKVVVEPWLGTKIQTTIDDNTTDYMIKIEKVHVSILHSEIELENIVLISKSENEDHPGLSGEIESIKFEGIHLIKALFKKEIDIREIYFLNSRLTGEVAFTEKKGATKVAPIILKIENLFFDNLFIDLKDTATVQTFLVRDGNLKLSDINFEKRDTLSPENIGHFDFDAIEFKIVTPDSLYTLTAIGLNYSVTSKILTADSFAIKPNYTDYGFTDKSTFQTDRFEGRFSQLSFYDFPFADFIKSGNLTSSFIEIGEFELNIFRDKRKEFRHIEKPTFQDLIYNYPGTLNIDSIGILSGNIVYSEHAEVATEKGSVSFNEIEATIYKITNDTIYKKEKTYLELNANALLMGKSKIAVILKARIFDSQNTFAVNGTLSAMEASDLNPMWENSAFISITSGNINELNFSFSANNTKATGNLKLLYHGLNIVVINKKTGESTGLFSKIKSMIANAGMMDSNPMPGEEVRPGIIEYERDPERFLFNYIVNAIISGIKPSIAKPGQN